MKLLPSPGSLVQFRLHSYLGTISSCLRFIGTHPWSSGWCHLLLHDTGGREEAGYLNNIGILLGFDCGSVCSLGSQQDGICLHVWGVSKMAASTKHEGSVVSRSQCVRTLGET